MPASEFKKLWAKLKVGVIFLIQNVLVGKPEKKFRVTTHEWKLSLMSGTRLNAIKFNKIPLNTFHFTDFEVILKGVDEEFLIGNFHPFYTLGFS